MEEEQSFTINRSLRSVNYDSRNGTEPTVLVLHYTVTNFERSVDLLTNNVEGRLRVSSHYLVPVSGMRTLF